MGFRMNRMSKFYVLLLFLIVLFILCLHSIFKKKETINTKVLLAAGIDLLEEAGKRVVEIRRSPYMNVQHKLVGKTKILTELLTNADVTSHKVIKYGLTSMFPGLNVSLQVISEEHVDKSDAFVYLPNLDRIKLPELNGGEEVPMSDISVWIDPLDATQEYSDWAYHSHDLSYTSWKQQNFPTQSLIRKPRIIVSRSHAGDVNDMIQNIFNDKFDILPAGGSGYKAIEILEGRAEAYLHKTFIKKWDVCAPDALLHLAGLKMTDLRGLPIEYSNSEDFLNIHGVLASRDDITTNYDHYGFLKALKNAG